MNIKALLPLIKAARSKKSDLNIYYKTQAVWALQPHYPVFMPAVGVWQNMSILALWFGICIMLGK
jgi:hypothetical protein